jgi:hypothetical protein
MSQNTNKIAMAALCMQQRDDTSLILDVLFLNWPTYTNDLPGKKL